MTSITEGMSQGAFLAALKNTRAKWSLDDEGYIRGVLESDGRRVCPVTAVCYALTRRFCRTTQFALAAELLGLPLDFATKVCLACSTNPNHLELRAKVLEAVGLK